MNRKKERSQEAEGLVREANVAFGRGLYEAAAAGYRKALRILPWNPHLKVNLATALVCLGEMLEAEEILSSVIADHPELPQPHDSLGTLYIKKRNFEEAIRAYRHALHLEPGNRAVLENLARVLFSQKRYGEAVSEYERLLLEDPGNIEYAIDLGNCLTLLGDLAKAEEVFRSLLARHPDNFHALNNLGNLLFRKGRNEEAAGFYLKAIEVNPDSATVRINLGNVYLRDARFDDAIDRYREALQTEPLNLMALDRLVFAYRENGRMADAIHCYRKAKEILSDFVGTPFGNLLLFDRVLSKAQPREEGASRIASDAPAKHSRLTDREDESTPP